MVKNEDVVYCDFCGKSHMEAHKMVKADATGAAICSTCVLVAVQQLVEPSSEPDTKPND